MRLPYGLPREELRPYEKAVSLDYVRVWLSVFLTIFLTDSRCGEITFLGPVPYRSLSDSPFSVEGLGSTFYLEDFETGMFQHPDLAIFVGATVRQPGPTTDSVDGDDGIIDGSGLSGHSLTLNGTFEILPTFPLTYQSYFNIFLPASTSNAVGFVWTDAFAYHDLGIEVQLRDSRSFQHYFGTQFMDDNFTGETAEDHFIGVIADSPITALNMVSRSRGFAPPDERFELDHFQFGVQPVPEPFTDCKLLLAIVSLMGLRRHPTSRQSLAQNKPLARS